MPSDPSSNQTFSDEKGRKRPIIKPSANLKASKPTQDDLASKPRVQLNTRQSSAPEKETEEDASVSSASEPESGHKLTLDKMRYDWVMSDLIFLGCIGLSFYLAIIFAGYSPQDPGFSHTVGTGEGIVNYGGQTGAFLSSMILYFFGIFGYLLPIGITVGGWMTLKNMRNRLQETIPEQDLTRFGMSLLGIFLFISAGAGLTNLFMAPQVWFAPLPYSTGGVWGYTLSNWLVSSIDLLATTLVLLGALAWSLNLILNLSWMTIFEVTGEYTERFAIWFYYRVWLGERTQQVVHLAQLKWQNLTHQRVTDLEKKTATVDGNLEEKGRGSESIPQTDPAAFATEISSHSPAQPQTLFTRTKAFLRNLRSGPKVTVTEKNSGKSETLKEDAFGVAEPFHIDKDALKQMSGSLQQNSGPNIDRNEADKQDITENQPTQHIDAKAVDESSEQTDEASQGDLSALKTGSENATAQGDSTDSSSKSQSSQNTIVSPEDVNQTETKAESTQDKLAVKEATEMATQGDVSDTPDEIEHVKMDEINLGDSPSISYDAVDALLHEEDEKAKTKTEPHFSPQLLEEERQKEKQKISQEQQAKGLADELQPMALEEASVAENQQPETAGSNSTAPAFSVEVGKRSESLAAEEVKTPVKLPSLDLLDEPLVYDEGFTEEELTDLSYKLEQSLQQFGVEVTVESVQPGPVVTRFEILPAPGIKVAKISNLSKDLARVLMVESVRVVDVIVGKSVIGIEIPNKIREVVSFKEVLSSKAFQESDSPLSIALGKDISGEPVVANIAKMPHLLVAGTTGAGKSVGVNSMILSILYKSTAEDVRMIMIDPKMLELSIYEDIPHLLTPVVTDMNDAANALRWCVFEMERRYELMSKLRVRNMAGFNEKVKTAIEQGKPIIDPLHEQLKSYGHNLGEAPPTLEPMPYIVVVIDEFADMIMTIGKDVEQLIARLAQKARAAGIHLILATQRPSSNVITGLIKANIPTRIAFMVNTKLDSRIILEQGGAEQLLGKGDMLYMPPGSSNTVRVHGAFMSDDEVNEVAEFVKSQGEPQYLKAITEAPDQDGDAKAGAGSSAEDDPLYDEAVAFITEKRKVSVSLLQRHFSIGYNRSARIVEGLEAAGLISAGRGGNNVREVLVPRREELDDL